MSRPMREIVFIDPQVEDIDVLQEGLRPGIAAVMLSAAEPAPRQMARTLAGLKGLATIHVIAHGAPGEMQFAAGTLAAGNLDAHAADLAELGRALDERGELLLWCSSAGQGRRGAALTREVGRRIGAGVATAPGPVGAVSRGGQWRLRGGASHGRPPLTTAGIAAYQGVMA